MRYHFDKPELWYQTYGKTYICNHPVYNRCTLFLIDDFGLAVIQQRYNAKNKTTWWDEIDPWLVDKLYLHEHFIDYFESHAGFVNDELYPTVTIRQIMWGLRMKPLPKEPWETVFDRVII